VSTSSTVLTHTQYPDLANQTQCQEYFKALRTGYPQSKWVAEMLLQAGQTRGLATTIYRLPLIGAARCTGASNSSDLVSRLIDQCHRLGCIPEMNSDVNVIPVDDAADMFVAMALRGLQGVRYNIVNDASLSMKRLNERMKALGEGELKSVSGKEWLRRCAQSADGTVLAAILKVIDSPIDDGYLDRYLLWRMKSSEQLAAKAHG
jgi:thioester reductase-like protein